MSCIIGGSYKVIDLFESIEIHLYASGNYTQMIWKLMINGKELKVELSDSTRNCGRWKFSFQCVLRSKPEGQNAFYSERKKLAELILIIRKETKWRIPSNFNADETWLIDNQSETCNEKLIKNKLSNLIAYDITICDDAKLLSSPKKIWISHENQFSSIDNDDYRFGYTGIWPTEKCPCLNAVIQCLSNSLELRKSLLREKFYCSMIVVMN